MQCLLNLLGGEGFGEAADQVVNARMPWLYRVCMTNKAFFLEDEYGAISGGLAALMV